MNNITSTEIEFIKKIDINMYSISTDDDFIYNKLKELELEPKKTKEFIYSLIKITNGKHNMDFDKIIYCLHINFIKILKEQNNLNNLNTILNNCGIFNFNKQKKLISISQYINI